MNLSKKITVICLVFILGLGFLLRNHNLYTWPRKGATFDEYAWTWQGMNLIQKGVPISWSPHKAYTNYKSVIYQQTHFRIVTPFLEHPPVFGLVAGSFALLNGASDMYHLDLIHIRQLALLLGITAILLVFLLAQELYGRSVGLIAALLYATVPTTAIGSKIVQNENFFIVLWLLILFLVAKYLKNKKARYRNIAAVLCGLLILAKIPWIAATFSVAIIFLYEKKYKDIGKLLLVAVPMFFVFILYGVYYDKEVFFNLWGLQLNRYDLAFTSIYALFSKPYLVDRFYLDGWIYWGWFSSIVLFTKDFKKHIIIISALLSYFLVFLAGIPDEAGHGWYRYPFYPFLIIATSIFLYEYFTKNWLLTFFFLVFVGTTLFELTWVNAFGFSYIVFRICLIGWGIALIPQYLHSKKAVKLGSIVSYSWLIIFILLNTWATWIYNEQ